MGTLAALLCLPAAARAQDTTTATAALALPPVVVSATRYARPALELPVATTVVPRREIDRSAGVTSDLILRALPSAATFRRSSSLIADPTASGLNLRGVGPSGVSRALVLHEGVPVNDGFGGWVYWRALSPLGIEQLEVTPSGGSALHGNYALGGVVHATERPIEGRSIDARASYGSFETAIVTARATERAGPLGLALGGEVLQSDGHTVVAPWDRGLVDRSARSSHGAAQARAELELGDLELIFRGGYFLESQSGGTRYTTAEVERGLTAIVARSSGGAGVFELTAFGQLGRFDQQRARISAGRARESLATEQHVPSDDQGASLSWTPPALELAGTHQLLLGVDLRRVYGRAEERIHPPGSPSFLRVVGGEQHFAGLFVQDALQLGDHLELLGGLRLDLWRNLGGHRRILREDGVSGTAFEDRTRIALSPRLAARFEVDPALALRGAVYRAFRAPTLNELYRPFQVGTVQTAANPDLEAETLTGGELGADWFAARGLLLRVTGFWNVLSQPITNVTLPEPLPGGAQRQRQNLGQAQIRGVELGIEARPSRRWTLLAAYTLADARVTEQPAEAGLLGKKLPQDPAHRASASVTFDDPSLFLASLQLRWLGPQFEDDRNELELGGVVLVDLFVRRLIASGLSVFAAVENLFDREYLIGRAGVDTIGPPFSLRFGLELAWSE